MTDFDSSVWTLAGGAGTVFVLAVVLKDRPWAVGFVAVLLAVGLWSLRARMAEALALGGIGWLLVTGFEVNGTGALHFTGWADADRGGALAAVALAGFLAGWLRDRMIGAEQGDSGPLRHTGLEEFEKETRNV